MKTAEMDPEVLDLKRQVKQLQAEVDDLRRSFTPKAEAPPPGPPAGHYYQCIRSTEFPILGAYLPMRCVGADAPGNGTLLRTDEPIAEEWVKGKVKSNVRPQPHFRELSPAEVAEFHKLAQYVRPRPDGQRFRHGE